jgi:hypothetical protein
MLVVLARPAAEGNAAESDVLYSSRTIDLPRLQTEVQDDPTQTAVPPTPVAQTSAPEQPSTVAPTLQVEPTTSLTQTTTNAAGSRVSPFTIALVPVALLLLGVLGIVIRQVMRPKDR